MTSRAPLLLSIALLLLGSSAAAAQTFAAAPPLVGPLTVSSAVAGQEPNTVTISGGTYTIALTGSKYTTITARVLAPLPANTTLTVTLASPGSGAQSVGPVALTTNAQPVITALPKKLASISPSITYTFSALSAAGVQALQSVSVILELAP